MATVSQAEISRLERLKPHQFRPGQSGNPLGRNAGRTPSIVTRLKRLLCEPNEELSGTKADTLVKQLYDLAASKGPQQLEALREIINRIDGKPLQRVEVVENERRQYLLSCMQFVRDSLIQAGKEPDERLILEVVCAKYPEAPEVLGDLFAAAEAGEG